MEPIDIHPKWKNPSNLEIALYRYVNLPKALSLLQSSGLHLANATILSDRHEGALTKATKAQFAQEFELLSTISENKKDIAYKIENTVRSASYVNCWCAQNHENEALWQIYGGEFGVAFRTTFAKLKQSLPEDCSIGMVKYVDPSAESQRPTRYLFDSIMHKRHFYRHERECRVLYLQLLGELRVGQSSHEIPPVVHKSIDMAEASFEIIVSPLSPKWYYDTVSTVVSAISPNTPVLKSSML